MACDAVGGLRRTAEGAGDGVFGTVLEGGGEGQAAIRVEIAQGSTCLSVRRPSVRVPVLSKITVSMWFSPSSTCPRVISRPSLCRLPVAAVSAVGVASDRAQGQVATSSDSTTQKARWWSTCHHSAPTAAATSRTMSRNH